MFYGWIMLVALWLIYLLTYTPMFYGFGIFVGPLTKGLGITLTQAALGYTLAAFGASASDVLAGYSMKRFGEKWPMVIGAVGFAVAALLMATVTHNVWMYYLMFILIGVVNEFTGLVAMGPIVSNWFIRRRAFAMSLIVAGGGLGSLIIAPAIAKSLEGGNWQAPWYLMAGLGLLAAVITIVFIRNKPSEIGRFPDGAASQEEAVAKQNKVVKKIRVYKTLDNFAPREAYKTSTFIFAAIGGIATIYTCTALITLGPTYLKGVGISEMLVAGAIGTYGAAGVVARLVSGYLADIIEPKYIFGAGFLIQILSVIILLAARTAPMAYAFSILAGVAFGMNWIIMPNIIVNNFGVKNYSVILGVFYVIVNGAGAVAPFITSALFDATKTFTLSWTIVIVLSVVSLICALLIKAPKRQAAGIDSDSSSVQA